MPISRMHLVPIFAAIGLCVLVAGCGKPAPDDVQLESEPLPVSAPEIVPPEPTPEAPPTPESTPADAPAGTENGASDWVLAPGERAGAITAESTEADLIAAYGAENVVDDEFHIGEGEMMACTTIFPEDDGKRAQILWEDPENKVSPTAVSIDSPGSHWKTAGGISVGTGLKTVQELNGKPFTLYGFGWDYGGRVADFQGGSLGTPEGALQLEFQLDYEGDTPPDQELAGQVMGDSEFASDHPAMQGLNPKVYSIVVGLGSP